MSNPEPAGPNRRSILAAVSALMAAPAAAEGGVAGRARQPQFVHFAPMPTMVPIVLSDLRSHAAALEPPRSGLLLLNLWATWCPACREELPRLATQLDTLARLKVRIAAVSIDAKPPAEVEAYARKVNASALRIYHDPAGRVISGQRGDGSASPFQNWRMPPTFVVDAKARVRGYMPGSIDWLAPDGMAILETFLAG